MMQDTVLSMCKESVAEFVDFIRKFIPDSTEIINTGSVKNYFPKKVLAEGDDDESLS